MKNLIENLLRHALADLPEDLVPAAAVFWWRARSWSRRRVAIAEAWARGGATFGQQLAEKRD